MRYDIEGVGIVDPSNASLTTFCCELERVLALKLGETAYKVRFHSGAGTSFLDVRAVANYDFHRVKGPPFIAFCLRCKRKLNTGDEPVYADSNGPPFEAYYDGPCVDAIIRELET